MLPPSAPTSFLSRLSRLRPVRLKSASGGHRRYTAPKLFEMPSATRDSASSAWKPRWSAVLAQTNQPIVGYMTINSRTQGNGIDDGHSWIDIHSNQSGESTGYGTWGNTGPANSSGNATSGGVMQNEEKARGMTSLDKDTVSRTVGLTADGLKAAMGEIGEFQAKGPGAWNAGAPCSTFAHDVWKAGTGEALAYTKGGISNPTSLAVSIVNANGGSKNSGVESARRDLKDSPAYLRPLANAVAAIRSWF